MKTRTRPNLRVVVASILASCSAIPLVAANAQEQDKSSALDEVVVTGTRIRGAAPVGSSVISLDRESIVDASGVTVDRIIKELPQIFDLGVSESSRGQAGGAGNIVFGNALNIHGIGPYATLVLLDGHRTISNSRSIDPSFVPSLGLERIEIVADGASAAYGSDAVAGVVNLIPRRTLDGIETSVRYGTGDHFNEYQAGLAGGIVWASGQFMLAYEHSFRSNLNGNDRDFYTSDQRNSGGNDYRVTRCNPGTISAVQAGVTNTYAIPQGTVTTAGLTAGTRNLCDDLPGQDLLPQQRYNVFNSTFTQKITDAIEVFADGFYAKREFARQPAYGSAALTVPSTNAFFVQVPGTPVTSYTVNYNFLFDLPRNTQTGSSENWEVTPGLRFKLPHDFQIEALYTYGKNDDESFQSRGVNNAALNTALASNNPSIAFDPYGLGRTSGATLAAISDQIFIAPTLNKFKGYELRVNGPLFDLPGGAVRIAAGYEGQEMDVSLGTARGGPTTPMVFRDFSRRVDSAYAEIFLPIVGQRNAVSAISRLEFTAAVRYDKYDDVGKTTNPKFGLNWAPINSLTFRSSYGTSFRAPLISEIYGNSSALFAQSYQNPAGGAALPGIALSGGNLSLKPEEATTWSLGFDWDPTDTTRLALTYFDVHYEGQVANYLSNLSVLSFESEFDGTGVILHGTAARDRVLQLIADGYTLASGSFPGGSPNNVTLFVDGRNNNLGTSVTRGIDFQLRQHWNTDSAGIFAADLSGTYFTKYEVSITPTGTRRDLLNTIYNPLKLKARAAFTWSYSAFTTGLTLNYVNGYDNTAITPTQSVSAYTPIDLSVRLHGDDVAWFGSFGKGFSVGLEVRNAFDTKPPYVNIAQGVNGGGGYDPTAASPVGRLFAVSVRKNW